MVSSADKLFTRATEPSCPKCAFALTGLPDRGKCPECGGFYSPDNRFALIPPSPLRAILYGATPLAWAALAVAIAAIVGWDMRSEYWAISGAMVTAILVCACIVWASWRFVALIHALQTALPKHRQERSATIALGCLSSGVVGVIGVVAFGAGVLLTVLLSACLVEGMPGGM